MASSDFQDFIAFTRQSNLAKANRYSVYITGFPFSIQSEGNTAKNLSLMSDAASHAGYSIGTKDASYSNTAFMLPDGSRNFNNTTTVTFLLDEAHQVKVFFKNWMDSVVNKDTGFISYPADYICDTMTVNQLDMLDRVTYFTTFYNVYPVEIGEIQVSNDASNTFSRLTVVFQFEKWDSTAVKTNSSLS